MAATFNADEKATLKILFSRFCDTSLRLVSLENFTKATSFSKSNLIGKCYVAKKRQVSINSFAAPVTLQQHPANRKHCAFI